MRRAFWSEVAVGMLVIAGMVLIVAGTAAALVAAPTQGPAELDPGAAALKFSSSEVVSPTRRKLVDEIEFSGALVAPATAIVRAKAAGTLLRLQVTEGSRVNAGQVIGQIDDAELSSRMTERRTAVESARTQLAQAKRQHQADVGLAAQHFISNRALESSKSALNTARLQLESALAQLTTGQLALRDTGLVAPIRGLISKRHALAGEKLSLEQPVVTIIDLSHLVLAGLVGTHQVRRLAPGMPVDLHIEGTTAPVTGRIDRVAPAAEPGTRSISVIVEVPNPEETLRAGQYGQARVAVADATECLTLPLEAVARSSGQDLVWLIENGKLMRRAVTISRRDAVRGCVEAQGGLTDTAIVLATSFDSLREGARAAVAGPSRAPGPTTAQ
jgi:membrane fusion protein (multidrug efflux system)